MLPQLEMIEAKYPPKIGPEYFKCDLNNKDDMEFIKKTLFGAKNFSKNLKRITVNCKTFVKSKFASVKKIWKQQYLI